MKDLNREVCPRCGNQKLKSWDELTGDEKILIEKLPLSADITKEKRRRNRWCARCRHEFDSGGKVTA
jgi:hypothetical protein